jgi:hypothetical protein
VSSRLHLKQFVELRQDDFERQPVWVNCHTVDYDEPWYDEIDDETFRPWLGALPVLAGGDIYLVAASFELADGTRLPGFVTPAPAGSPWARALPRLAPNVFGIGTRPLPFWLGIAPKPDLAALVYRELKRTASQLFPLTFRARTGLAFGQTSGQVEGFTYWIEDYDLAVYR